MKWYSLSKLAALEAKWWNHFYEHLTQNVKFLFEDNNMPLTLIRTTGTTFTSGLDGKVLFFSFCVVYKNNTYDCGINLEFADSLIEAKGKKVWKNGNLIGIDTDIDLVKASWYVIRNFSDKKNFKITGRGFFLPQNTKPNIILTAIKNSILQDGGPDKDDDNGGNEIIDPTPNPSKGRKIPSLPRIPKKEDSRVIREPRFR